MVKSQRHAAVQMPLNPHGSTIGLRLKELKMRVTRNEWTPLFQSLKEKVSPQGRRRLLFQLIGDLQDISMLNFGDHGINRPAVWAALSEKYAHEKKKGNMTPTLILKGDLLAGFVNQIGADSASLTNIVDYADQHQFGVAYKKLPPRPFYPVDDSGELTEFAKLRQEEIVRSHFEV